MDIGRSLETAFSSFFNAVPTIIGALIVLLVFWIIAGILGKLVTTVLQKLRVDSIPARVGVQKYFTQAGVNFTVSSAAGTFVKWFIRIMGLTAFCNALGLVAVTTFLNQVLLYLPNVIVAVVIVLIGSLIAQFVGKLAGGAATTARLSYAGLIGRLVQYAILFFVGLIVLEQLGIGSGIVIGLWAAVSGGITLALAIAVGFGGREIAHQFLTSRAIGQDLKPGMTVALNNGVAGRVISINTLYITISTNEGTLKLPTQQVAGTTLKVLESGQPAQVIARPAVQ